MPNPSTHPTSLDALGNMPSVTTDGTAVSRTHDDQNQIASIGASSVSYSYGNLSFDGTYNYTYDVFNRLITVWNSDESATIASYAYDALGRRITESPTGSAATEVYYSANWQALPNPLTHDQSSHAKNQYVWSPVYIDALIERDRDADNDGSHTLEERLYAQQDANFNLTAITSTSGSVQERYLFDPYGSRTVPDSSFAVRSGNTSSYDWKYGHQGFKLSTDTTLLSCRRRDLSPAIDRWLQTDPQGYANSLNLYQVEQTNPIFFGDPFGAAEMSWWSSIELARFQATADNHEADEAYFPRGTLEWDITTDQTPGSVGAKLNRLVFTPKENACPCKKIGFIQVVVSASHSPGDFADPGDDTAIGSFGHGWVDHAVHGGPGDKLPMPRPYSPFYQIDYPNGDWTPKDGGWGNSTGNGPGGQKASMTDNPGGLAGDYAQMHFETFAVWMDKGSPEVLGGLYWGYHSEAFGMRINQEGGGFVDTSVSWSSLDKPIPMADPSEAWWSAVNAWNLQATAGNMEVWPTTQ